MNPCPKAAMREIRPSGLMSGIWKRGSALPRQISTLHKPKRSRDFRAMEPLRKRLWRRIGFKQTETRCWAASQVCERCGIGTEALLQSSAAWLDDSWGLRFAPPQAILGYLETQLRC